jgi:perosamine synthetase
MIGVSKVVIDPATEQRVLDVLRSGQLAQGPMVAEFEGHCQAMAASRHAVAVNNGTTALILALQAAGIGPGDEVISTPFTFAATLNAIVHVGASVRFADITDDFTIDPAQIASLITPSTKAIMPVHLYGLPAAMDEIDAIARTHHLTVVEDAAQAHGALVGDRPVGTSGLACFSFYATKNISTGEGGVITTNDDALADRMRVLRNQGMRARYEYEMPGFNYRMMDLVAALAIEQFHGRAEMEKRRRLNAQRLTDELADLDEHGLELPREPTGRTSVWHQYTVRVTKQAAVSREAFIAGLAERGVGAGIYYPKAAYDYACFRSNPRVVLDPCPIAEQFATEVVSIPVHQHLSDDELTTVIAAVRAVVGAR